MKKFVYIEVFYEIVDFPVLDMSLNLHFAQNCSEKQNCYETQKSLEVSRTAKSCSKRQKFLYVTWFQVRDWSLLQNPTQSCSTHLAPPPWLSHSSSPNGRDIIARMRTLRKMSIRIFIHISVRMSRMASLTTPHLNFSITYVSGGVEYQMES